MLQKQQFGGCFTPGSGVASKEGEATGLSVRTRRTPNFTFSLNGAKTRFEPCWFKAAMFSESQQIQRQKRRFYEPATDHLRRSRKRHGCVSLCASAAAAL